MYYFIRITFILFSFLFFHCVSIDPILSAKQGKQEQGLLLLWKQNPKKFQEWAENWQPTYNVCTFRGVICEDGVVTELHLVDVELETFSKEALSALVDLKVLVLFHNHIKEIDLTGLENIEKVNLSQNQLEQLKGLSLPHLKVLDLTQNQLASIDVSELPVLEKLYLDKNKLTEASGFSASLLTLNISENKLTTLDLRKSTRLGFLYAESNDLSSIEGFDTLEDPRSIDISENSNLVIEIPKAWCTKLQTKVGPLKLEPLSLRAANTKANIKCGGS